MCYWYKFGDGISNFPKTQHGKSVASALERKTLKIRNNNGGGWGRQDVPNQYRGAAARSLAPAAAGRRRRRRCHSLRFPLGLVPHCVCSGSRKKRASRRARRRPSFLVTQFPEPAFSDRVHGIDYWFLSFLSFLYAECGRIYRWKLNFRLDDSFITRCRELFFSCHCQKLPDINGAETQFHIQLPSWIILTSNYYFYHLISPWCPKILKMKIYVVLGRPAASF